MGKKWLNMSDLPKPQLVFFAGVNGAGKSTIYEVAKRMIPALAYMQYINPDLLTEKNHGNFFAGAKEALAKRRKLVSLNIPFVFESTFSGKSEFRLLEEDKNRGYKINGVLVGVSDSSINVQRILQRVSLGGHFVPPTDVERRVSRLAANYIKIVNLCDRLYVVDNSRGKPFLSLLVKKQKLIRGRINQKWIQEFIDVTKIKKEELER